MGKKDKKNDKEKALMGDPRRLFCDRAFVLNNDEHFVLAFQTGTVVESQYAFTPKHAKRFLLRLKEKIEKYEAEYGEMNVTLPQAEDSKEAE